MHIQCQPFNGNCGMQVLYHFDYNPGDPKPKDKAIIALLSDKIYYETAIVAFSGSETQEDHKFSPQFLAAWLKKKGERVTSASRLNYGSGNKITAYYWTISDKMAKKLGLMTRKEYNLNLDDNG